MTLLPGIKFSQHIQENAVGYEVLNIKAGVPKTPSPLTGEGWGGGDIVRYYGQSPPSCPSPARGEGTMTLGLWYIDRSKPPTYLLNFKALLTIPKVERVGRMVLHSEAMTKRHRVNFLRRIRNRKRVHAGSSDNKNILHKIMHTFNCTTIPGNSWGIRS